MSEYLNSRVWDPFRVSGVQGLGSCPMVWGLGSYPSVRDPRPWSRFQGPWFCPRIWGPRFCLRFQSLLPPVRSTAPCPAWGSVVWGPTQSSRVRIPVWGSGLWVLPKGLESRARSPAQGSRSRVVPKVLECGVLLGVQFFWYAILFWQRF